MEGQEIFLPGESWIPCSWIQVYLSRNITYKEQIVTGTGCKPMIYSPQEYQILIDSVEKGYGLVTAMHQINKYREEEHLPNV
jgi:hypothetical protein